MIRRPMQWSDEAFGGSSTATPWEELDPAYVDFNVAGQIDSPDSLLAVYRNLITLRAAHPALALGDYLPVDAASRGVYAFLRQKGSETLLVVVNLTKSTVTDYALGAETSNLRDAQYSTADLITGTAGSPLQIQGGGFSSYKPLEQLEPYTGYIFTIVK